MMTNSVLCAIFWLSIQLLPVVNGEVCPADLPFCSQSCEDILSIQQALQLLKGVAVARALEATLDKRRCGDNLYCCSVQPEKAISVYGQDNCGQNIFLFGGESEKVANNISANSRLTQWPWMASFGHYQQGTWIHKCGGTVITNIHVLTAAHCVRESQNDGQDWLLRIGDNNLTTSQDDHFAVDLDVKETIIHPKYDNETSYFDVAVLKVDGEIKFTTGIQPVCLPREPNSNVDNREGDLVSVTGWGKLSRKSSQASAVLQRAPIAIYSQGYCNGTHDIEAGRLGFSSRRAVPQLFQSNTLCAGYEFGELGSCPGDSGGPLVKFESAGKPPYYVQLAIVHGGINECGDADLPGIYTRLEDANVLDFITNTIGAKQSNKNANKGTKRTEAEVTTERDTGPKSKGYTKIIIATGYDSNDLSSVEVIDTSDSNTVCKDLPPYHKATRGATGGLIGNTPLICGGGGEDTCYALVKNKWQLVTSMTADRFYSASAVLGNSLMVTGGLGYLDSSDLVGLDSSKPGPTLPGGVHYHCSVSLNDSTIMIIGGWYQDLPKSKAIYYYHLDIDHWIRGPDLNTGREDHSCGTIKSSDQVTVVAVGGVYEDSVEVLRLGSSEWSYGTPLPFNIGHGQLVPDATGKGILLIGGLDWPNNIILNSIYHMACVGCDWVKMAQSLKTARRSHVAIPVPDYLVSCE